MPIRHGRGKGPPAGPNGSQNGSQSGSQNGNRPVKVCHTCNKTGHIAKDCRSSNGGQDQSQSRGSQSRGNQTRGGSSQRQIPADAAPYSDCYMHGPERLNSECTNPNNVHSGRHAPGAVGYDTQVNQIRQRRDASVDPSQQTYFPSSEKYYPRCNQAGHLATECTVPAAALTCLRCIVCKSPGHTHQTCKHPNACHKCRTIGHTTAACRNAGSKAGELRQWVLNQRDTVPDFPHTSWASAWVTAHPQVMAGHGAQTLGLNSHSTTGTWWKKTTTPVKGIQTSPAATQAESAQKILEDIRKREQAEYDSRVKNKLAWAKANYKLELFHDKIQNIGLRIYAKGVVKPIVPKLNSGAALTPHMAELIEILVKDNTLIQADTLIKNGWTFFRDPQALEAVYKKEVPVCNCCGGKGTVRDARFMPVAEGQNLLDVPDWDDWGVNVSFDCECVRQQAFTYCCKDSSAMDLD